MIPKVIHYCWFGNNLKSDIIQKCIESWKNYCPDYEIIEWNESNFDVNCNTYVKAAYNDKKWAFVSDYARLYIIYKHGGVYLDTDVLLHNNLDDLLGYKCWLASDDVRYIATGLGFGAEKGNKLIGSIMAAYEKYEYPSGTNVIRDTKIIERELPFWRKSDRTQVLDDYLLVGMKDYGKYATHLYTYTWADEETRTKRVEEIKGGKKNTLAVKLVWKIKCCLRKPSIITYLDSRRGTLIEKIYTFIAYDLLDYGFVYFIKRLILKIRKFCIKD